MSVAAGSGKPTRLSAWQRNALCFVFVGIIYVVGRLHGTPMAFKARQISITHKLGVFHSA